jgi:hypothetical protein
VRSADTSGPSQIARRLLWVTLPIEWVQMGPQT